MRKSSDLYIDYSSVRLIDVQTALRSLLPSDAILVGQSLNSDLDALKLMHPYIIGRIVH
jgi:hypothetical protein